MRTYSLYVFSKLALQRLQLCNVLNFIPNQQQPNMKTQNQQWGLLQDQNEFFALCRGEVELPIKISSRYNILADFSILLLITMVLSIALATKGVRTSSERVRLPILPL